MPKVFISHSTQDKAFIEKEIIPLLTEHGIQNWYCQDDIKLSSDWEKSIRDGLKSCDWFMVIMSKGAEKSEWVRSEVNWALDNRKGKVIPLLKENCEPSEINLRLNIIQYVDFREINDTCKANLLAHWKISYKQQEKLRFRSIYPSVVSPTNLGFDESMLGSYPLGWFNSRFYVSGVSEKYKVDVLPREDKPGNCAKISSDEKAIKQFGSLMQRCVAYNIEDNLVRIECEIKTKDVNKRAGLWVRADGETQNLFFYNMSDRPIVGTTEWQKYSIEFTAPKNTIWLNYGVLLLGSGEVYVDNFTISCKNNKGEWQPWNQWCYYVPTEIL